jgi:TonB family protein
MRSIGSVNRSPRSAIVILFLAAFLPLHQSNAATASNKLFVFYGEIDTVDASSRTFTLRSDKGRHVFIVTEETKILRDRTVVPLQDLKAGQLAAVEMRLGAGGKGLATSVTLMSRKTAAVLAASAPGPLDSLFAATTRDGKQISAGQLKPLVLYYTWPRNAHRVIGYLRLKIGVFLLSVRSDGTVENVETLQSTGHRGADADTVTALRKWRFRPNSVKEVRVPSQYTFSS